MRRIATEAHLLSKKEIAPSHYLLSLKCPSIAKDARPGQFVLLRSFGAGMPLLSRPFSVYRAQPARGLVEFLIKEIGAGTRAICLTEVGKVLGITGPLGRPFRLSSGQGEVLLVGGGTGVAPLTFLAEELERARTSFQAILGFPSRDYVALAETIGGSSEVKLLTEDGSEGIKGFPTDLLPAFLDGGEFADVFACGPTPMLAEVARICAERGASCQVSLEGQLGCGIEACYGCSVPALTPEGDETYKRICADGPVFATEELDWQGILSFSEGA